MTVAAVRSSRAWLSNGPAAHTGDQWEHRIRTDVRRSGAQRITIARVVRLLVIALWSAGCGGHKDHSGPSTSDTSLLVQLNAQFNDGRTVRWASLPVPVFLNGIARADEVNAWA